VGYAFASWALPGFPAAWLIAALAATVGNTFVACAHCPFAATRLNAKMDGVLQDSLSTICAASRGLNRDSLLITFNLNFYQSTLPTCKISPLQERIPWNRRHARMLGGVIIFERLKMLGLTFD
jgi:hypothetical protein